MSTNAEKFMPKISQPIATVEAGAPAAAEALVSEAAEERKARVDRANQAIREILTAEHCVLTVPKLDISTGRVFAEIVLLAQALPQAEQAPA